MAKTKQISPLIKAKIGPALGFRTPSNFRGKTFSSGGKSIAKFNPATFKTQHKG